MIEINNTNEKRTNANLKNEYTKALTNPKFKSLTTNLKITEKVGMKYTSNLENTVSELCNCENCSDVRCCKNLIKGYVNYPQMHDDKLIFSYVECKNSKKAKEEHNKKLTASKVLDNCSFKDLDLTDKNRAKTIKWIKDFYDKYKPGSKGLYLHGNFGCGKTYIIAALFNEMKTKKVTAEIIYFPELLRKLKDDWDTYARKMDYLMTVDLLLIDDIGAEKVTEWGRDEVLGTILQYRMDNKLSTFFTSNFTINELETHLQTTNGNEEKVKARRIIERIKQLTIDSEMISINRRN